MASCRFASDRFSPFPSSFALGVLPSFRWSHQGTVISIQREHYVVSRQILTGHGYQSGKRHLEVQRFQDASGGVFPIRCLQLVAHIPAWGQ